MKRYSLVFSLYLAIALIVTFPLVLHLNTLIIDRNDSLLITWIQNWVIHSLTAGPSGWLNILNANIFYPYQNVLAFSDFHLVSALLAMPVVLIFKEPLAAFNLNLILGLALTGFSTYLLAKFLTHKEPVSIFAGILLTFSTIHLNYMPHPQLFHLWLLIFPVLFLLQNRVKLYVLFFVLAVANSPLNLYFLLFLVAILKPKALFLSIIPCLLSLPFLLPYFSVSQTFGYSRPITDAINFSLQFPDLANVSIFSRLSVLIPQVLNTTPAYFGTIFVGLILIMFTIILYSIIVKSKRTEKITPWLWLAGLSFVLSLGPALHIFRNTVHLGLIPAIPLPYTLFYYFVPGFSGFRTPSRWIIVTALSLCLAISIYFAKKITWRWAIFLSVLVLLEVNFPFKYSPVPKMADFPPEQIWLKDNYIGAPIIQFPIYGWFDGNKIGVETLREYYSTIHWHPMFNGYSGFSPKEWEDSVKWLQREFPSDASINFLKNKGIKLILTPRDWQIKLKLVKSFPATNIYELN